MEKITYPLLIYPIQDQMMLGILVGTDYQLLDKDIRSIKSTISAHLQKQYKRYDDYPFMDILKPHLKMLEVQIRPSYHEDNGTFPLTQTVTVAIPLVYGETDQGYYECFLPLFDERFYYYEKRQFEPLARHFIINILNNKSPEEIYGIINYPPPILEEIILKVNHSRDFDWGFQEARSFEVLERLAEKYPYSKTVQKNISALPEAAWEMEAVVTDVMDRIMMQKANVLLVGNHGVGKSAVLQQAIKKIHQLSKKEDLAYTFWRILSQRITASSKYLGEWQETVESLIGDLNAANGVLWVLDIVELIKTGGGGAEDSIAAFLLPFLQQERLQLLGEVTPEELESMRRLLPGFVENFQIIQLGELPEKKVQAILKHFSDFSSKNLKIKISEKALTLAYRLLLRYYPYESFPGKGVKFIAQCINEAQLNNQQTIDRKAVISNFTKQTGLPELFLRDDLLLDQTDLQTFFSKRIIGQPQAVKKLCGVVKIYKAGLNNPYKPITSLIFAGPTGVGKTASAKALADYFFGKGQKKSPLIRIDMSEFQHPSQIIRFIGSGQEPGQLVKEIRERPFSVLLLDEVEKADPSIFDALMNAFDEGMMIDAFGRITNFRNTIIIMTSNLGASNRNAIGYQQPDDAEANYLSAVSKHFRPEFVNRIDGIVMFNTLNDQDIRAIAIKELNELKQREGLKKQQLEVLFTPQIVDYLVSVGFNKKFGARPLQRALEDEIVKPIAAWLLKNPTVSQRKIKVDFVASNVSIELCSML